MATPFDFLDVGGAGPVSAPSATPGGIGAPLPPFTPKRFDTGEAGVFGNALNWMFGPTQFAVQQQRHDYQQDSVARAMQKLTEDINRGTPPAQAVTNFLSSPEGVRLFTGSNPDTFRGIMQDVLSATTPKPTTLSPGQTLGNVDPRKPDQFKPIITMPNWQKTDRFDQFGEKIGETWIDTSTGREWTGAGQPPGVPGGPVSLDQARQAILLTEWDRSKWPNPYVQIGNPNNKQQRAYGAYQVMDFNIGPWTQEVLGKRMSPQEFLASPEAQDKVAQVKLAQLYAQYNDWNKVALAWFTGSATPDRLGASDVNQTTGATYQARFAQNLAQVQAAMGAQPATQPGAGAPIRNAAPPQPGAPVRPPGAKGTTQTRMLPTPEQQTTDVGKNETTWQKVRTAYGIIPTMVQTFSGPIGQFSPETRNVPIVRQINENRRHINFDVEQGVRLLAGQIPGTEKDPTRAQAEMDRLRKTLNLEPNGWKSEADGYEALRVLDTRLRVALQRAERNMRRETGGLPQESRKRAAEQAAAIRDWLATAGVPAEGTPERDRPPTMSAEELFTAIRQGEEPVVRKSAKEFGEGKPQSPAELAKEYEAEARKGGVPKDPKYDAIPGSERIRILKSLRHDPRKQ